MGPEAGYLGSKGSCTRQSRSNGSVMPTARWGGAAASHCLLMAALVSVFSPALQSGGDLSHPGLGGSYRHLSHHPHHAVAEGKNL